MADRMDGPMRAAWDAFLAGHWTKQPPTKPGWFPVRDREGHGGPSRMIPVVAAHADGTGLYQADRIDNRQPFEWQAFWWSEPMPSLPAPPAWDAPPMPEEPAALPFEFPRAPNSAAEAAALPERWSGRQCQSEQRSTGFRCTRDEHADRKHASGVRGRILAAWEDPQ